MHAGPGPDDWGEAMQVSITVESIEKANAQFWEQMLTMLLVPVGESEAAEQQEPQQRCIGSQHVAASCALTGTWAGRIEVRLSAGLALEATAAMLMQPAGEVQASDKLDAAKEIANMIAGTLKSSLPRPSAMTVPTASIEEGEFCAVRRTVDSMTVFFKHSSGELMVRVLEEPGVPDKPTEGLATICP